MSQGLSPRSWPPTTMVCYLVSVPEGQDSVFERIRGSSAWLIITVILTVIGLGGVPDDLRTWSGWLEATDSWIDRGWVRILAVIMAALTLLVKAMDLRHRRSEQRELTEEHQSTPLRDSESIVQEESIIQENKTRLVDTNCRPQYTKESPESILEGNDELTNVAIKQKSNSYIGKTMRASGIVLDVEYDKYDGASVTFRTDGDSMIVAYVNDTWKDDALSLTKGSRLEVIGGIAYVSSNHIRLNESQLLPPDLSVQLVSSVRMKNIAKFVSELIEDGSIEANIGAGILSKLDPNQDIQ